MGDKLYQRLKELKQNRASGAKVSPGGAHEPGHSRVGPEPLSRVAGSPSEPVRDGDVGEWHGVAPLVVERTVSWRIPELPDGRFFSQLLGADVAVEELRFMDTETTGLSGGAGTTVFLVGTARIIGETEVEFRQTLLTDFPGERAFVERVMGELGRETVWVSYNGKAFDARQLQTRCVMNGIRPAFPLHIDLLHWSRRLWRRMFADCSLGTIERMVLDVGRNDDLPSAEIPERYFRFLDTGDRSVLAEVFEHHLRDVRSLISLFLHLEGTLSNCANEDARGFDHYGLGRWLIAKGDRRGPQLLRRVITGGGLEEADVEKATLYLLRHLRRCGHYTEALQLVDIAPQPSELPLVEEYAKFFEHDLRDPGRALACLEAYLYGISPEAPSERVARRFDRLKRKTESP